MRLGVSSAFGSLSLKCIARFVFSFRPLVRKIMYFVFDILTAMQPVLRFLFKTITALDVGWVRIAYTWVQCTHLTTVGIYFPKRNNMYKTCTAICKTGGGVCRHKNSNATCSLC
jgi:hypothetical protein